MLLKKILIYVITLIIFFGLFSIFFSLTSDISVENFSAKLLGVIYDNADEEAQFEIINILKQNCLVSTEDDPETISLLEICNNQTLLNEITQNCNDYYDIKNTFPDFTPNLEFENSCNTITNGTLDDSCNLLEESPINLEDLLVPCNQYLNNETDNRTFFVNTILTTIPEEGSEESSKLLSLINTIDLVSIILLAPLVIILFLLHLNKKKGFFRKIGNSLFSLGFIMIILFILLRFYSAFSGFDTTHLLESMKESNPIEQGGSLITISIPVMNSLIKTSFLIIGAISLLIGLALKLVFKKEKQLQI